MNAKKILNKIGMSQGEIANALGVTVKTVYNMRDKNHIPSNHWQKLISISDGRITWEMLEKSHNKEVKNES